MQSFGIKRAHAKAKGICEKEASEASRGRKEKAAVRAARRNHANLLQSAIENSKKCVHITRDDNGDNPLIAACKSGQCDAVWVLVYKGAKYKVVDPVLGRGCLSWACHRGHEQLVRQLLNGRGEPGYKGIKIRNKNPYFDAKKARPRKLKWDIEVKDMMGCTPLMLAAWSGHSRVVCALLEAGADANAQGGTRGWTPLIGAINFGHQTTIDILIKREDLDVDVKARDGATAMLYACRLGNHVAVRQLLDLGAHPEVSDVSGNSGLHWAAKNNDPLTAEHLIQSHMNRDQGKRLLTAVSALNKSGRSPVDIAKQLGHAKAARALKSSTSAIFSHMRWYPHRFVKK